MWFSQLKTKLFNMREIDWVENLKELLIKELPGESNLIIETKRKLPYACEIKAYDENWKIKENKLQLIYFETDLLIYEKTDLIKPRVVLEAKLKDATTHDTITYSQKAFNHKFITPYLSDGLIIGNKKTSLSGKLFRHGQNFDFIFKTNGYELSKSELEELTCLVKKEVEISRQIERIAYESKSRNKEGYDVLVRNLKTKSLN